jgi:hypothetical protein
LSWAETNARFAGVGATLFGEVDPVPRTLRRAGTASSTLNVQRKAGLEENGIGRVLNRRGAFDFSED